ncbi:MAG: hypothetical protein IJ220_06450 [Clostridia bacterium]|nr:hypothetical protein [Clostridia bacterium]
MLLIVKIFSLLLILALSSFIGVLISNKYNMRVKEIEDIMAALDLLETRVKYTYDTIADSFDFISENMKTRAYRVFMITASHLLDNKNMSAGDIFRSVVDEESIFLDLNKEDIEILKGLGTSLGQMDLEGQLKNIILVKQLLKSRLEDALEVKNKNFKLSRNMGVFVGLIIMIILI